MLTTLKSYLGMNKGDIDAITAPLGKIVASLDAFLAKSKSENDADRATITDAEDRISARSREITRAAEVKANISGILGGVL